ncbi:hypothetical protein JAO76_07150 [Pontibacter sp. BT310]|uniref:Uncharacterized protein n=1 Tax=Pontibacter populi TaxID=890055 RepID=A0ABS6X9Z1_9BACT|nr:MULTISPECIES: hypothetical protein [Pontibacter]MBJ6117959.1 hypothetical protein [Pontibacter sp. BT310]MBR0570386.1 hypothetical protein [Microvirga sp. STS03]MBW3364812.1 hypothetical protein [Pontibacter populi]
MKQDEKNDKTSNAGKKQILREDDGKRLPPQPKAHGVGGAHRNTRPEQGPDIPPHERTEGIP